MACAGCPPSPPGEGKHKASPKDVVASVRKMDIAFWVEKGSLEKKGLCMMMTEDVSLPMVGKIRSCLKAVFIVQEARAEDG